MALTMYFWDYILTFEMEVDLVWKARWNFVKGLYLFQRYLPFTELIWFVLSGKPDVVSVFSCSIPFHRAHGGLSDGDSVSEGILR